MNAYIGWAATAVVTASYFFKREQSLRAAQMVGASMWLAYGIAIDAMPVIAANMLVFSAAAWTTWRKSKSPR